MAAQTKLWQTFRLLGPWELHHLRRFLASPFFNKRKDVVRLADLLIEETEKKEGAFNRRDLYLRLYQTDVYEDQKMRLLCSRLYKLIEHFLACRELLDDEVALGFGRAKAFQKLGQEKAFVKALDHTSNVIDKRFIRNASHLQYQYELEQIRYQYSSGQSRSKENNLQAMCDSLDTYFLAAKLRQGCLMLSQQTVYRKIYKLNLLEATLIHLQQQSKLLELPVIAIYFHCYKAMTVESGEEHFRQLRQLIQDHHHQFPADEIRDIYLLAINYCIRQLNTGHQQYVREGFEMYRNGLADGFLLDESGLSPFTFKNAVALGLSMEEYDWVESFLMQYQEQLPVRHREHIFNYNLAKLRQAQGNYPEAMRLLIQFDSSDYLLNLGAKTMLLKMYYELEEMDALESLLESMGVYLNRKEVLGYHKEHFRNILLFTRKLMSLPDYDKAARQRLRERIAATDIRSEKEWFLDQLD